MRGDTEGVRTLLRGGADVNAAQGDGMTALHWTALDNDLETMDVLLYAGAATEALTRVGAYTPLHLASSRGHAAAVARLLEAGSKVRTVHGDRRAAAASGGAGGQRRRGEGAARSWRRHQCERQDARPDAAHLRGIAGSPRRLKLLLARGADARLTTTVIDYQARAAADTQARQLRDKIASARTGRAIDSNFNPDPPPPGAAARVRASRAGQGAARGSDRFRMSMPAGRDAAAAARGRRRTSSRSANRAASPRCTTRRATGSAAAALALLDAGVDVNVPTDGDQSTPMVVAIINGQYDLALTLLARGADPNLANDDGVTPLFATLNNEWALRTWYPQPTAGAQQQASYLELLEALLKAGADPNARTLSHIWYAAYNTGRMGVDFSGATPFWRAAYALDVDAMRLLVRYGADPHIPTVTYGAPRRDKDPSGLPAVPSRRSARAALPCRERRRLRHVARGAAASARAGRAGCGRPSTSSRSSASTSTSATRMASPRCITRPRGETTRRFSIS